MQGEGVIDPQNPPSVHRGASDRLGSSTSVSTIVPAAVPSVTSMSEGSAAAPLASVVTSLLQNPLVTQTSSVSVEVSHPLDNRHLGPSLQEQSSSQGLPLHAPHSVSSLQLQNVLTTTVGNPLQFHIREDTLSRASSFASPGALHQQNMQGFVESQAYSDIDSNPLGRVLKALTPSHDQSEHVLSTKIRQLSVHMDELDTATGVPVAQRFRLLTELKEEVEKTLNMCKSKNLPKLVLALLDLREKTNDRIRVIDLNPHSSRVLSSADNSLVISEAMIANPRHVVTPEPAGSFINNEDEVRSSSRLSDRRPPQADKYVTKVRQIDERVRKHEDNLRTVDSEMASI